MPRRRRAPKYLKLTNVLSDSEYEAVLCQAQEYLYSYLKRWQVEFDGRQTSVVEWLSNLVRMYQREQQEGADLDLCEFAAFHGVSYEQLASQLNLEENKIDSARVLAYYGNPDVQRELLQHARERQLLLHYNGPYVWGFRSRENIVPLAFWIMHRTKRWPSFHASVARYDELGQSRRDIVFEIDHQDKDWRRCFELSRPVLALLRREGIPFRIKFSGNASAHIIVPAEILPGTNGYYEGFYTFVRANLKGAENLDMTFLTDPYHLLRLPYALNEFTGLVSVPIPEESFDTFTPTQARVDKVNVVPGWWPLSPDECRDGRLALLRLVT